MTLMTMKYCGLARNLRSTECNILVFRLRFELFEDLIALEGTDDGTGAKYRFV